MSSTVAVNTSAKYDQDKETAENHGRILAAFSTEIFLSVNASCDVCISLEWH
jgi:hypothetical protein